VRRLAITLAVLGVVVALGATASAAGAQTTDTGTTGPVDVFEVSGLIDADMLVEIEADAIIT